MNPGQPLLRATAVAPAGHWAEVAADSVVLDFDERHRRRVAMTGVQGLAFLLDLPDAVMLRGGDGLRLEDGRVIEVVAAPEPLVEVRGAAPADLVRLAWHIGNRHLPAQILKAAIRIRRDHVIEEMLTGLRAKLTPIEAPFDPEGGAYASAPHGAHAHDEHGHEEHGHDHHGHEHHEHDRHGHDKHGHDHAAHDHDHGHAEQPSHDHDHDHGHGHRHG